MTRLRQRMREELPRRNYARTTVQNYVHAVEGFAQHFHTAPDPLNQEPLRPYQAYRLGERKLAPRTAKWHASALRFFFVQTRKRPYLLEDILDPKVPRRLPVILTREEVERRIDSARNLMHRTLRRVLYSTGLRNSEMRPLPVPDLDRQSMLLPIQHGQGGPDRYVPLSPQLLETLRAYGRGRKPPNGLFPGTLNGWRTDQPITPKVVWDALPSATKRAGIAKRVYAHLLRPSYGTHRAEAGADRRAIPMLLGHVQLEPTVIYLHLSRRHLQAIVHPLDTMNISRPETIQRSRKLQKK